MMQHLDSWEFIPEKQKNSFGAKTWKPVHECSWQLCLEQPKSGNAPDVLRMVNAHTNSGTSIPCRNKKDWAPDAQNNFFTREVHLLGRIKKPILYDPIHMISKWQNDGMEDRLVVVRGLEKRWEGGWAGKEMWLWKGNGRDWCDYITLDLEFTNVNMLVVTFYY